MQIDKKQEFTQEIAVFGESGSGKTVLVSSFYGAMLEPSVSSSSSFSITASDTKQGMLLHQNYLGMKKAAVPQTTRFNAKSYDFLVKPSKDGPAGEGDIPIDILRVVWHDYPGDWFEQESSSSTEEARRIGLFKALLGSDVALILIDGQKLLDNAGREASYLKSVFANLRTTFLRLEDSILEDGKKLKRFPRIWVIALSKADLLPDLDVFGFRDLVVGSAAEDVGEFQTVLERFVEQPKALCIGQDFVRLSSAQFEPEKIDVSQRIGLDLVLPIAAIFPIDRLLDWMSRGLFARKMAARLIQPVYRLSKALRRIVKDDKQDSTAAEPSDSLDWLNLLAPILDVFVDQSREALVEMNRKAQEDKKYMEEILTEFKLRLDDGENQRVICRRW